MIESPHARTSDLLKNLMSENKSETISLEEISSSLSDKSFAVGILLFAIPNSIPLGIPGISSVCAVPITLFGLQMMLARHHLWLPQRFANIVFSTKMLNFAIEKSLPTFIWIEKFLKPRAATFANGFFEQLCGFMIVVHAAVIFLPIPFGNFLPAICMCVLALALLENDGYLVILSLIISVAVLFGMSFAIFEIFTQMIALLF